MGRVIQLVMALTVLWLVLFTTTGNCSSPQPSQKEDEYTPASIVYEAPAFFDPYCRRIGVEGTVKVTVEVLADGSVGTVEVIDSPEIVNWGRVLRNAARNVARRNKYRPAHSSGRPVDSVIELSIDLAIPRNPDGSPDFVSPISCETRSEIIYVPERTLCLYGHWVSGNVEIRLDESRCYVDGIRFWPEVTPLYHIEIRKERVRYHHRSILRIESELLWRDLVRRGVADEAARDSVISLVGSFPGICRFSVDSASLVEVEFCDGESFEFVASVPYPGLWPDEQPRPGAAMIAEQKYYDMLSRLERGQRFVLAHGEAFRTAGPYSVPNKPEWDHDVAMALAATDSITAETWDGVLLSASLAEMIRKPWWVFKQ